MKFKIKIKGLGIEFKEKIVFIDDLRALDLLKWIEEFEDIAKMSQWSNSQCFEVLKNMIRDKSVSLKQRSKTYVEVKKDLLV